MKTLSDKREFTDFKDEDTFVYKEKDVREAIKKLLKQNVEGCGCCSSVTMLGACNEIFGEEITK